MMTRREVNFNNDESMIVEITSVWDENIDKY